MDKDLNIFQNAEVDFKVNGGPTNIGAFLGSYDKVILKPNKKGSKNVLEQWMLSAPHTKYVIKYDFNLEDTIIVVPEDCIIDIDCGSLQHGTLVGNSTGLINANNTANALVDITLDGTWNCGSINPEWFDGTDAEKIQKAIDFSLGNKFQIINISRTYDLTGNTVYIDRGQHTHDDISPYSKRKLTIQGTGEARFLKKDEGYMFSSHDVSLDIAFISITFEGYTTDNDDSHLNNIFVFNCNLLRNISTFGCSFNWCGCVYHADDSEQFMQGIYSINNVYCHNKNIAVFDRAWDIKFIADVWESGYNGVIGNDGKDVKIDSCCIESFVNASGYAISVAVAGNLSITNNYFEHNYHPIYIPGYWSGVISGNGFHSRNNIPSEVELHCIEIGSNIEGCVVEGNTSMTEDANMYLIYFKTDSSFYVPTKVSLWSNNSNGINKTNVPSKIVDTDKFAQNSTFTYRNDIINAVKQIHTEVSSGSVILHRKGSLVTISFLGLVTTGAIIEGSVNGYQEFLAGPNNAGCPLIDGLNNISGLVSINTTGNIYIRVPAAGTYNGSVAFFVNDKY